MAFLVFLMYLVLTFVRPGERFPDLRAWPIMDVASVIALGSAGIAVLLGRGQARRAIQLPLVIALWGWAFVSVVMTSGLSSRAMDGVLGFGKASVVAFLLTVTNVVSVRRLKIVGLLIVMLGLLMAGDAAKGKSTVFVSLSTDPYAPHSTALVDTNGEDPKRTAPGGMIARAGGEGAFGDPNDLAVMLLSIVPLALALRRPSAPIGNTLFVWLPIAVMVYAIYLTRSRGGVIALAVIFALSVRRRVGTVVSLVASVGALLALLALGFTGGRAMERDMSAMGRVWAWADGLQMLKRSPLWGVGLDNFVETHGRAAHNVYVQCFSELGLVGYSLWLGLILATLDDLRQSARDDSDGRDELAPWARAVSHALLGVLVGGLFLSRAFEVSFFILLGLGTAIGSMVRRYGRQFPVRNFLLSAIVLSAAVVGSISAHWMYMRVSQ